jgi:hypothetical protein
LKEDVLFRGSEALTGSKWDTRVVGYLNRVYRTLASGASEFLPEYIDDWWWLRSEAAMNLEPVKTGNASLTKNSASITFSAAVATSVAGWRLKIEGEPTVPLILTHTAGGTAATLDTAWPHDTNSSASYYLMKVEYTLSSSVQVIIGPMSIFHDPRRVIGVSPERMDELYPIANLTYGVPQAFSLEDEATVRFSHGGLLDGYPLRVEYRFRPKVVDLIDSPTSIPLVPAQWMHVLSDMALTYLLMDKNDDRANAIALSARTGLAAMLKENRKRNIKIDPLAGKIVTRPGQLTQSAARPIK